MRAYFCLAVVSLGSLVAPSFAAAPVDFAIYNPKTGNIKFVGLPIPAIVLLESSTNALIGQNAISPPPLGRLEFDLHGSYISWFAYRKEYPWGEVFDAGNVVTPGTLITTLKYSRQLRTQLALFQLLGELIVSPFCKATSVKLCLLDYSDQSRHKRKLAWLAQTR